jgi:hypothetical protein
MARPYSEKLMISLSKGDPSRIGVQLGKICVKANLPSTYLAQAFDVSRASIHNWFRGQYVRSKNYTKIDNFIKIVEQATLDNILPAETLEDAKKFIDAKVIDKI